MNLSTHDWGMIAAGGALALVIAYIAYSQTPDQVVAGVQTEAQFAGIGLDLGGSANLGSLGAIDPNLHFYRPGYDPVPGNQPLITMKVRYPYVSGGNVSTLIHRGMASLNNCQPKNVWLEFPPSEASV